MKYIVKGRVKKLVQAGNPSVLRPGSYHYLPVAEVLLSYNRFNIVMLEEKFRVCGLDRMGFYKRKNLYFKYLCDLKIEVVPEPNARTLAFMEKRQIYYFEDDTLPEVKEWLQFFEENSTPEILDGHISDDIFVQARQFVTDMQSLIATKNIDTLLDNFVHFPILIRFRKWNRENIQMDRPTFEKEMMSYFTSNISESILQVDPDLIFPNKRKMLVGLTEAERTTETGFKIHTIVGDYVRRINEQHNGKDQLFNMPPYDTFFPIVPE